LPELLIAIPAGGLLTLIEVWLNRFRFAQPWATADRDPPSIASRESKKILLSLKMTLKCDSGSKKVLVLDRFFELKNGTCEMYSWVALLFPVKKFTDSYVLITLLKLLLPLQFFLTLVGFGSTFTQVLVGRPGT